MIKKTIFYIDKFNKDLSNFFSWLILAVTLVAFTVVILRYFFNIGFVWLQESYLWMHGLVFLFGAPYALMQDKHVRVDIFYRPSSEKTKAYINIIFTILFLIPFIFIILKYSLPYVYKSWGSLERSRDAGGLGFLYLYKTSIIIFCFLLFFQSISFFLQSVLVVVGKKNRFLNR